MNTFFTWTITYTPLLSKADSGLPYSLFLGTAGLMNAMLKCTHEEELEQLYRENKDRIDLNADLRETYYSCKHWLRSGTEDAIIV